MPHSVVSYATTRRHRTRYDHGLNSMPVAIGRTASDGQYACCDRNGLNSMPVAIVANANGSAVDAGVAETQASGAEGTQLSQG